MTELFTFILFFFSGSRSLVEACIEGDIAAVRKLLDEGRSVHEPTDEGESLLSLACSAGKLVISSTFLQPYCILYDN